MIERHVGKYKKRSKSSGDRGAALITVIIVLAFISILCTLVLYIAAVNYRMKKADYQAKVSFYDSEVCLEEMQSNLVEPISLSYSYALQLTNSRYYTYSSVNDRKSGFYNNFYDQFIKTLYDKHSTASDAECIAFIKDVMSDLTGVPQTNIYTGTDTAYYSANADTFITALSRNGKLNGLDGASVTYLVLPRYDNDGDGNYTNDFISLDVTDVSGNAYDDDHIRVVFHDIYVVTVQNNTMSVIRTDIAIQLPPIDWTGGSGTTGNLDFNANEMVFYMNWQKR